MRDETSATGRLAALLHVRAGEGLVVALLLAHSFFLGLALVLFETAANGLFLHRFPADSLPLAFIGAAVCVPATGVVYGKLQRHLPPRALWLGSLGFLLSLQVALIIIAQTTEAAWPALLMMALTYVMSAVGALEFWGLAGRVLDLRQAKRLYGLIGSGEVAAGILGGLAVPLLLRVFELVHVLALAAASLGVCLLILAPLLRAAPPLEVDESGEEETAGGMLGVLRAVARDHYLLLIVGLYLFYNLSHDTLDYLNLVQIQTRFGSSSEDVASFMGVLFAVRQIVVLLARSLLSGRLLARFGLGAGLGATPALIVVAGTGIIALALWGPGPAALFVPVITLKVVERIFWNSLGKPAILVAYRPLSPQRRDRAQLTIETLVEPLSTGLTGAVLLLLSAVMHSLPPAIRSVGFASVLVVAAGVWLYMSRRLRRGYTDLIVKTLGRGSLRSVVMRLDQPTLATLGEWLKSHPGGDVIYLLGIMEDSLDQARFARILDGLFDHPDPNVRVDVLGRIERLALDAMAPLITARLEHEREPLVRAALVRALAALGETAVMAHIAPFLDDPDPLLRRSCLVALLKYNGVSGVLAAGHRLLALIDSPNPTDRRIAAEVVGEVGVHAFYHPLRTLLGDEDLEVRATALRAAGKLAHPRLWPVIIEDLAKPTLWKSAADALAGGGDSAAAALAAALDKGGAGANRAMRVRIVRILGRIRRPEAVAALRRHVVEPQAWLRVEVLAALRLGGWYAESKEDLADVDRQLHAEVGAAAAANAALADIGTGESVALLRRSLEQALAQSREMILMLLAFVYRTDSMRQARVQLRSGSAERKTFALEVLDNLCAEHHKRLVLPLVEELAPEALRQRLAAQFPEPLLGRVERLRMLAAGEAAWVTRWLRGFAAHALAAEGATSGEGEMEDIVKKVMLLKSVKFFATAEDDVLAELATEIREVRFAAGETVIEKGKTDSCMYIIQTGAVRVHDDDRTLAVLTERAVFGELAALNPQPRTRSVTATMDSVLLRIDHATVVDLMAEHIEIAQGIIRYLIKEYGPGGDRRRTAAINAVLPGKSSRG